MTDTHAFGMRLLEYKNILRKLKALGFSRVFSSNLADSLGISASLVRKDFTNLAISGNRRGGYQVDQLTDEINRVLSKDTITEAIVVGAGKLGAALMNYGGFADENLHFVAAFDIDPGKLAPDAAPPVLHADDMAAFVTDHKVCVAVLAVPGPVAQRVADVLVLSGIKGFLNFAPQRLVLPEDCSQNHINLAMELEKVVFQVGRSMGT